VNKLPALDLRAAHRLLALMGLAVSDAVPASVCDVSPGSNGRRSQPRRRSKYMRALPAAAVGGSVIAFTCCCLITQRLDEPPWPLWGTFWGDFVVACDRAVVGHAVEGKRPVVLQGPQYL